jgi:hypothetical protein
MTEPQPRSAPWRERASIIESTDQGGRATCMKRTKPYERAAVPESTTVHERPITFAKGVPQHETAN